MGDAEKKAEGVAQEQAGTVEQDAKNRAEELEKKL